MFCDSAVGPKPREAAAAPLVKPVLVWQFSFPPCFDLEHHTNVPPKSFLHLNGLSKEGCLQVTPTQKMFLNLSNSYPAMENIISKELSSSAFNSFRGVCKGSPTYSDEMSFLEQCGSWYLLSYIQLSLVYEFSIITHCGVRIRVVRLHKSLTWAGPSLG